MKNVSSHSGTCLNTQSAINMKKAARQSEFILPLGKGEHVVGLLEIESLVLSWLILLLNIDKREAKTNDMKSCVS